MKNKKSGPFLFTRFAGKTCAGVGLLSLAVLGSASAQSTPTLNVDPTCRGIAQQAGTSSESGGPDLTFKRCVQSEMATRRKLLREWSTFTHAEKSNCVAAETSALLPSYTDLITCVEMARDVRRLRQ